MGNDETEILQDDSNIKKLLLYDFDLLFKKPRRGRMIQFLLVLLNFILCLTGLFYIS